MFFYHEQLFCNEPIEKYTSMGLTVDDTKGALLLGQPPRIIILLVLEQIHFSLICRI